MSMRIIPNAAQWWEYREHSKLLNPMSFARFFYANKVFLLQSNSWYPPLIPPSQSSAIMLVPEFFGRGFLCFLWYLLSWNHIKYPIPGARSAIAMPMSAIKAPVLWRGASRFSNSKAKSTTTGNSRLLLYWSSMWETSTNVSAVWRPITNSSGVFSLNGS